jgi:hypothetical protein
VPRADLFLGLFSGLFLARERQAPAERQTMQKEGGRRAGRARILAHRFDDVKSSDAPAAWLSLGRVVPVRFIY